MRRFMNWYAELFDKAECYPNELIAVTASFGLVAVPVMALAIGPFLAMSLWPLVTIPIVIAGLLVAFGAAIVTVARS